MKLTTLRKRFSRRERVQRSVSLLLPAHPALLEARQLALQLQPKTIPQDSIRQDREQPDREQQEQQYPKQEVPEKENAEKEDPEQDPNQDLEQQDPPRQETCPNIEPTPTAHNPSGPRRAMQRSVTNLDLRSALGTYLDYLPLVGKDGEKEKSPRLYNTLYLNEGRLNLKPKGATPSLPTLHTFPSRSTESDYGSLAKSGEVVTSLGMEEIHQNTGKRARSYPNQATPGVKLPTITGTEDEIPIPPRNPARLLKNNIPNEMVSAVSFRWQRRHNKRAQLAAGSNSRPLTRVFSPIIASHAATPANSSETMDRVQDSFVQGEVQKISKAIDAGDDKNENRATINDNDIGLGISIKNRPTHVKKGNRTEAIKTNTNEGQENGSCASTGRIHAGKRELDSSAGDMEDDVKSCGVKPSNAQNSSIGLGINVYGICESLGYSDEDDQLKHGGDEDLNALVKVLVYAFVPLFEIPGGQGIEAVGETVRVTGPNEIATAVEGMDVGEEVNAHELTGVTRYIEASQTIVTDEVAIIERKISKNIDGEAKAVEGEDEETLEAAPAESVSPILFPDSPTFPAFPTPPLSVAVFRSVAHIGTSTSSSGSSNANAAKPPSDVNNEVFIDELLEINYRGQAESFNKKFSGAPAVRSFSTHSGTATSSLRATSQSSAPASTYTPSKFAEGLVQRVQSLRSPSAANKVVIRPFAICHGGETRNRSSVGSGKQDHPPSSPHVTYGHRFYTVPGDNQQLPVEKIRPQPINLPEPSHRGIFYFTEDEREYINQLVHSEPRGCEKHPNCIECYNIEYAYIENKVMSTSIPPEERNRIISNNRSLRNIKNELEALAENGAISNEQFDMVMSALPSESPLSGPGASRSAPTAPTPPTTDLNNLNLGNLPSPPSYTAAVPPPPSLPDRRTPSKPELIRAAALYRYAEPGDCNFEVGDQISVYEYMNADWWLGKNLRTGEEGVFPVNYVQPQANPTPPSRPGPDAAPAHNPYTYGNEKGNAYGGGYPPQQQQYQGYTQPGPIAPYNNPLPQTTQATEETEEGKGGKGAEMGKKFGKKLGNAAIFGAGATLGSDLVHSIF